MNLRRVGLTIAEDEEGDIFAIMSTTFLPLVILEDKGSTVYVVSSTIDSRLSYTHPNALTIADRWMYLS